MSSNQDGSRRLLDLFGEQATAREKSARLGHFRATEMSELKAIAELGKSVFGNLGLLETGEQEPGILYLGYYIDPPSVPSHRRRRKLIFRFCRCAELEEQIAVFRSMSSDQQRRLWGADPAGRPRARS